MKISKTQLTTTAALLMAATQIQASPFCLPRHLNGHYVMYQNSVASANLHTGRCEVSIDDGIATGNCAFTLPGAGGPAVPGFAGSVTGTASLARDCSAQMKLDFSPAPNVTVSSDFDLQFAPDRQSFIGQWSNNFGLIGTSAGVRK